MDSEAASKKIRALIDSYFWPAELEPGVRYTRTHDDCDGDYSQVLAVVISNDGDAWVTCDAPSHIALRFRVPLVGGGASHRVRNALLILAEAIRLDNARVPIQLPRER